MSFFLHPRAMAARPMFPPVDPTFRIGNCAVPPLPQRSRYLTLPWLTETSIFAQVLAHASDVFDIVTKMILTTFVNITTAVGAATEEHLQHSMDLGQCAPMGP